MKTLSSLVLLAGLIVLARTHTFHMGACPDVEPMPGFQMSRFLGIWYVIEKTSTSSKCIVYNYTTGEEPGEYVITQDFDHSVLGLTPLKHEYHYTGELTVPEPATPARMQVRFPLSVAGSASHIIFTTDYDTYAGIFTCQKLALAHRRSATILSRYPVLDKSRVDQIHQKLTLFGVEPDDLNVVPQTDCLRGNNTMELSFGGAVRKAGEKIGEGVQWVSDTGSKVYHKLAGDEENSTTTNKPTTATVDSNNFVMNEVHWVP